MKPHLTTSARPATRSAGGQRGQRGQVAEHAGRRVERADQVLAGGGVDAGLAADRRVDHAEQRGRPPAPSARPRSQHAATKPARSVTAPPPTPTTASVRVKLAPPSASQHRAATSSVLPASASGTSIGSTASPAAAQRVADRVGQRAQRRARSTHRDLGRAGQQRRQLAAAGRGRPAPSYGCSPPTGSGPSRSSTVECRRHDATDVELVRHDAARRRGRPGRHRRASAPAPRPRPRRRRPSVRTVAVATSS